MFPPNGIPGKPTNDFTHTNLVLTERIQAKSRSDLDRFINSPDAYRPPRTAKPLPLANLVACNSATLW